MADNITLPASGAVVSTDDLGGGVQVQNVKNTFGPDGVMTTVTTTSGLPTTHTDNTNTANVLKGSDGTAAGQNAALTAGSYLSVPFNSTGAGNYATTDAGNYRWVTVQAATITSGSVYFQGSNDGTNWVYLCLYSTTDVQNSGSGPVYYTSYIGAWHGPLPVRYFRISTIGVSTGTILFHANPAPISPNGVWLTTSPTVTISGYSAGTTDAAGGMGGRPLVSNIQMAYSGVTSDSVDRWRNNLSAALVAAGTTTTQTNKTITTYNARSLTIVLNVSAVSGGSVTLAINGTTVSSYAYSLISATAVTATGVTVYRISPHLTAVSGLTAAEAVPRTVLVTATVSGSITYGIDHILSV